MLAILDCTSACRGQETAKVRSPSGPFETTSTRVYDSTLLGFCIDGSLRLSFFGEG